MLLIPERQLRAVRDLAAQLSEAPLSRVAIEDATRYSVGLIAADACAFSSIDITHTKIQVLSAPEFPQYTAEAAHLSETMYDHPLVQHWARPQPDLSPCRITDVVSRSDWLRTSTYGEVLKPIGAEHVLAIPLRFNETYGEGYAFIRSGHNFTNQERAVAYVLQLALLALHRRTTPRQITSLASGQSLELTARELEVLQLLCTGASAQVMAHQLHLSRRTVEKHLENLYRKLGTSDRLAAVIMARQQGFI